MNRYILMMVAGIGSPRWHAVISAENDEAAIEQARRVVADGHTYGKPVEVWQDTRMVIELEPVIAAAVRK